MRYENRREQLYSLLGRLPEQPGNVTVTKLGEEQREGYRLERLLLDCNGIEPVPAYFLRPDGAGRCPAVLYHHSHGGRYKVGKEELFEGAPYLHSPYGEALARKGFAVLAIDHWAFGERSTRTESTIFKHMLWRGQVMWGMMVHDSIKALDYLCARNDVDASRIGSLGMSMGSTMAWWLAALDARIKVTVDICCLTDFQSLVEDEGLDRHGLYYYVPDLLNRFTAADINALIAPRPHLSLAGSRDKLTPVAGLHKIDSALRSVYAGHGADDAWKLSVYEVAHEETAQMRAEALAFLDRWL